MSDTTYAEPTMEEQAAQQAAQMQEENTKFLDDLEKAAEEHKRAWMSARVPAHIREMFEERFPAPEPEEPAELAA